MPRIPTPAEGYSVSIGLRVLEIDSPVVCSCYDAVRVDIIDLIGIDSQKSWHRMLDLVTIQPASERNSGSTLKSRMLLMS